MTYIANWRILIVLAVLECVGSEICHFPEFLQSGKKDNKLQPWITRSWWINIRDNPRMREQREVYVQGSHMWVIHNEDKIKCERKTRRLTHFLKQSQQNECVTRRQIYNRTCIVRELHNKYRIAQFTDDGRSVVYVCMSFTLRSNNVVQITQGPMRSKNTPDLCADIHMYIDDWPWIASWKPEASACPVAGGFTFRTISRLTNQDVCENDWRRSKLEIECLKGDGMDFFAPKESNCNPFLSHGEWKRLYCWGGWTNGNHSFMIASGEENDPHFCMRFPVRTNKEFIALLYFSPICPAEEDGQPPTGIDYYELHLRRTDFDECEDENEEVCQHHAKKGMCEKSNNRYRPHCRKTCGLCGDSGDSRFWSMICPFSELVRGSWLLFENNREERVTINQTHVYFSNLGHFLCQERAPDDYLYKLVSNFNNGCSTRYTCIELKRPHNNILQFRLGRSYREDKNHAEMCNFKKDAYLDRIGSRYRSSWKKNLIRDGPLWESPCGLSGNIPFNATLEGHKCTGGFSDWNPYSCTYNTHITITTNKCYGMNQESQFKCIAFLDDEFEFSNKMSSQMILTKAMDGSEEFVCWVMTTFPGEDFSYPLTRIYKMPNLQCSSFANVKRHIRHNEYSYFNMLFKHKSKICEPAVNPPKSEPQNDSNITSVADVNTMVDPPYWTPKEPIKVEPVKIRGGCTVVSVSVKLYIVIVLTFILQ